MHLLTTLFVSLYDRYYLSEEMKGKGLFIRFIPSPIAELKKEGEAILEKLIQMREEEPENAFFQFIHPYFIAVLEDRLAERKLSVE